ncbi:hypothetical protein OHS33_39340 (plasmid) [Streptomyces sp. NBC_00536]|uniref:hypothetical protein n=1 Tax=Streptomyces sp. NBC_00536 TaxID=2975769 RepID=UPI002E81D77E|nr:hypothetical protein [Streptomyces sp. NBC_00536]WUC84510.1 hypothetical protein OHS33_39340 [Streptomyces sp. NBC_00536]
MPFLASAAGTSLAAVAIVVTARTRYLFDSPVLAPFIWVAAGLCGFAAGWALFRRHRSFRFNPLSPRLAVVTVAVAFAGVWGAQALAAQAFPSAWARYLDELGGPGRCLAGTPYGEGTATVVTMPKRGEGRMEIWPGEAPGKVRGSGVLRLDNAVSGGIHPLKAADEASDAILRTYGCR